MKKLFFLFLLLVSLAPVASAQNALYVYRNDGDFNAFLREDIDSIVYSRLDSAGVYRDEWQAQLFYTSDSVYRIPLAAIDSISLVTPEAKYRSEVFHLTAAHLPYLQSVADLRLVFSSTVPADLLPSKGQVVVSDVFDTPLEGGFAGRLASVRDSSGVKVLDFSEVILTDVYEHLVTVGKSVSTDDGEVPAQAPPRKVTGTGSHSFKLNNFTVTLGPVSLQVQPTATFNYVICIGEHNLKNVVKMELTHAYRLKSKLSARVDGQYAPEPLWMVDATIPTSIPGLYGSLKLGAFYRLAGQIDLSASIPAYCKFRDGFFWQDGMPCPQTVHEAVVPLEVTDAPEFSINLNGSVAAGVALRLGVKLFSDKLIGMDVTGKLGLQLKAGFSLSDAGWKDGTLYSALKDSKLTTGLYGELAGGYTVAGVHSGISLPGADEHRQPLALQLEYDLYDQYLLPAFSQPEIQDGSDNNRALVRTRVSRDLCFFQTPVQVGLALYDKGETHVATQYFNESYKYERDWPYTDAEQVFIGLTPGKEYVARPVIRIYGREMVAAPSSSFSTAIRVETGNASAIKENSAVVSGYADGLESAETLCELGMLYGTYANLVIGSGAYVGSGRKTSGVFSVSLGGLEENTTYYYRTCLALDGEYYYGEVRSFTTKKKKEPTEGEAIDLGLSVKWSSHNVGASSPEEYGGYYAWGETEEKEVYNLETYAYYDSNTDKFVHMGSISGTQYDVAHVKWGGKWRMPTLDEMKELIDKCTWEWTTYKGVTGQMVTGPNGNSIFLPAAGGRWDEDLDDDGSDGYYWSESPNPYGWDDSCCLGFDSYYKYWDETHYDRDTGLTVRPVTE